MLAVKRYARERGWPSSLVVERASVPSLTVASAAAARCFSTTLAAATQRQQQRPRTAPV